MKIAILDDYQDAVPRPRLLPKYWTATRSKCSTIRRAALGQLAIRLAPFDALVLIRERTSLPARPAGQAAEPETDLADRQGGRPRRRGGRDGAWHRDRRRRRLAGRAGRADLGADHGGQPQDRAVCEQPEGWLVADGIDQSRTQRPGRGLKGRTLAIWGYGKIGKHGGRLWQGLRHAGAGLGQRSQPPAAVADGFEPRPRARRFFEQADVLSLHLRLADATRGIVTAEDLARMKPMPCS
jgi:D-3-phosphoglycerate dehydrogenase